MNLLESESFGNVHKTHPIQFSFLNSSLVYSAGLSSENEQNTIDNLLLKICSSNENVNVSCTVEQLDFEQYTLEHTSHESYDHFPSCMDDALNFADDLIMVVENSLNKYVEQNKPIASTDRSAGSHQLRHAEPPLQQAAPQPPHVVEESKNSNRESAFKTGRDMYCAEGGKFEPKLTNNKRSNDGNLVNSSLHASASKDSSPLPPELAHCDKALVERIEADIIHSGQPVRFEDISGLEFAKKCVTELICWPMSRPDLFQGLRALPRGLLLFGPPGTGKTLIGKAIAHQSGATFFSISASSLMSKWIGEGEKLVRTLFEVAAYRQPAVVFMDEVDALLCQRSSEENEASRRMKTEFMVQLDGAGTSQSARVVVVGATNRPEELDEAVRRRFVKRIYIPLPDDDSRRQLFITLLQKSKHGLCTADLSTLVEKTAGYSGADVRSLCTEAAMGPVREIAERCQGNLQNISDADVPSITVHHFLEAIEAVLPTVSPGDLQRYIDWNSSYGSFRRMA